MLGHVQPLPGGELRYPRGRKRPGFPAPRKRDRPERRVHRPQLGTLLDAQRNGSHQPREDEQVEGKFLYHQGDSQGASRRGGPVLPSGNPLPPSGGLLGSGDAGGEKGPGPPLQLDSPSPAECTRRRGGLEGKDGGGGPEIHREIYRGDGR